MNRSSSAPSLRAPSSATPVLTAAVAVFALACGGSSGGSGGADAQPGPTEVRFGDTVLIVVANPVVNEANDQAVPAPGPTRAGIVLTSDDGVSATTGADGIAVLGPLTPGARTITAAEGETSGTFTVTLGDGELLEVALATEGARAEVMVEIDYMTDRVTEVTSAMSSSEVNEALAVSDSVVFFRGGAYAGDLDFSGSRVTLFGEGMLGGEVVLDGNVTVSGSNSRIRGTTITGNVTVPASGVGVSFSTVEGTFSAEGSDGTFLANGFCGTTATVTGSGSFALGNLGLAPAAACP